MSHRILTLLPPGPARRHPTFHVRRDLCARLVAHLEHRGFRAAPPSHPSPISPASPVAEIVVETDTPLKFLIAAKDAFLAQIRR
jgi:hypothetical protein